MIDRVFRRVEQKESLIAREGAQARELFEELMRHPSARQQLMVANSVRFLTRTMCEHLLAKGHEAGSSVPGYWRKLQLGRYRVFSYDCSIVFAEMELTCLLTKPKFT